MLTRSFRIHLSVTRLIPTRSVGLGVLFIAHVMAAQVLDPVVVSVARDPLSRSAQPYTVESISASRLDALPAYSLDDKLKRSAAFSLFRRSGSLSANPTTQGVSLRNIGPNGAGRTLVLVDGIPLNDPFGGWVAWAKTSPLASSHVEIVRGGGSGTWGSAALGGTINVLAASPPEADQHAVRFEVGDFGSLAAAGRSVWVQNKGYITADMSGFRSDGFRRKSLRSAGPIDRPTDLRQGVAALSWARDWTERLQSKFNLRAFEEERGNGTPLQANRTRELLLSAELVGQTNTVDWQARTYVQSQEYRSLFTAVDTARVSERPVLDQFQVPADAAGVSTVLAWGGPDARTTAGFDGRWVEGETRENFFRVGDEFTRNRRAGGSQATAGVFASHNRELATGWRVDAAVRLDAWALRSGERVERNRQTGAITRQDTYPDRSDTEINPRIGVVWQPDETWRWTIAGYHAYRLPTLNEFYRPFRIGSVITEANPQLKPEHLTGAEAGVEWQNEKLRLRATFFTTEITDAVANVTLGVGPGFVPGVGFVPNGGVGRQRQNLDQISVHGWELGGDWQATDSLSLRVDYLYSDARDDATGRWLPQAPQHTLVLGATWNPNLRWQLDGQMRHVGDAFEDDTNRLILNAATTLDLRVAYTWSSQLELFAAVENLMDEDVVTGRTVSGLVDLGTPRFVRAGATWRW